MLDGRYRLDQKIGLNFGIAKLILEDQAESTQLTRGASWGPPPISPASA